MTTSEAAQQLKGDLKTTARDAQELVRSRMAAALESAKVTARRLEERTVEAAKATDRTIRDHPYQAIGIAFGLGVLIGVLVSRK